MAAEQEVLAEQPLSGSWPHWRARRPPTELVHLDSAAAGRASAATLAAAAAHAELARNSLPAGSSPLRLLEPGEANIAGRVGLATAVREYLADGPARVRRRLADVGRLTRAALAGVPGWQVADPAGVPSAITALRPAAGQDVSAVRARLLTGHGIVTTAEHPARAPREMTGPLLRISPHVDCTGADLALLRAALAGLPGSG